MLPSLHILLVDNTPGYAALIQELLADSVAARIATLDLAGRILSVNKAWSDFAKQNNAHFETAGPGANFLRPWPIPRPNKVRRLRCGSR